MEAFFVALALDLGTPAAPELYGFERHSLASHIATKIDGHPACPANLRLVRQSINELGARVRAAQGIDRSSDEWVYFTLKMADAYLDWLYAQGRLREARSV